jgi:tetratricopeptide (TPR) repeat protein
MDEFGISMSLSMMSRYYWLKGNYEEALSTSHQALLKRQNAGFSFWVFNALQFHAMVLVEMGQFEAAATLLGASQEATNKGRYFDERDYAEALQKTRDGLSTREFDLSWARGLSMEAEEAFNFAVQFH